MVGHAEDRAERDADAMADTALGRLRVLAHELAHTLQPDSAAKRLPASRTLDPTTRAAVARGVATTRVISRWDWWDKRKARKADEAKTAKEKKDNTAYAGVSGNAASVA